ARDATACPASFSTTGRKSYLWTETGLDAIGQSARECSNRQCRRGAPRTAQRSASHPYFEPHRELGAASPESSRGDRLRAEQHDLSAAEESLHRQTRAHTAWTCWR